MVEAGSTATVKNGTVWNHVPFSPAGSRPIFPNSRATYAAALKSPSEPVSRPIIESAAMSSRRARRRSGVIAALPPAEGAGARPAEQPAALTARQRPRTVLFIEQMWAAGRRVATTPGRRPHTTV